MRRITLTSLVFLLAFAQASLAQEVYYRVASGEDILSFTNNAPMSDKMVQAIADRTFIQPFAADTIHISNYQLRTIKNIVWQGLQITQYDYIPLAADRFRHVLWVYGYTIVKMEIFNTDGKLMFSGAYLGADNMPNMPAPEARPAISADGFNFYGFAPMRTETAENGRVRVLFSDGLNRFSIFKEPASPDAEAQSDRKVVYANNVYHVTIDQNTYTVVGGLSFEKMQEALDVFIRSSGEFSNTNKN